MVNFQHAIEYQLALRSEMGIVFTTGIVPHDGHSMRRIRFGGGYTWVS